jgi:RNA recognition motif-containing protein
MSEDIIPEILPPVDDIPETLPPVDDVPETLPLLDGAIESKEDSAPAPTSEPSVPTDDSSSKTLEEQPQKKRRRRSGWDVPAPAAAPPSVSIPSMAVPAPILTTPSAQLLAAAAQTNPASLLQQLLAQQALQKVGGAAPAAALKPASRIYIGSINYDLKETDVVSLFSAFGKIQKSEMSIDPATGKSKGFCFIDYEESASADAAQAMDGFDLAGRKIKVGRPKQSATQAAQAAPAAPAFSGASLGGASLLGSAMGGSNFLSALGIGAAVTNPVQQQAQLLLAQALMGQASGLVPGPPPNLSTPGPVPSSATPAAVLLASQYAGKNTVRIRNIINDLELKDLKPIFDAFGTILSIDYVQDPADIAGTRTAYVVYQTPAITAAVVQTMNNFNLAGLNLLIDQLNTSAAAAGVTSASASSAPPKTVVLQNMITMEDTADPDLTDEIGEEAGKYGTLVDISINTSNQKDVLVVLKYMDSAGANKAFSAMNGRAFASRKIVATLQ